MLIMTQKAVQALKNYLGKQSARTDAVVSKSNKQKGNYG